MRDSNPSITGKDDEKYWLTSDKPEENTTLYEYDNKEMFRNNQATK